MTGSDLQDLLFQSLYDPSLFTAMPQVIEDLEAGRTESLATMESVAVTQLPFLTMDVYVSVQCHEEVAFADPAAVQQAAAARPRPRRADRRPADRRQRRLPDLPDLAAGAGAGRRRTSRSAPTCRR